MMSTGSTGITDTLQIYTIIHVHVHVVLNSLHCIYFLYPNYIFISEGL